MRKILTTILLTTFVATVSAQMPWWPTYESLSFPKDTGEQERHWDATLFALDPDYPFLNLLTEQEPDFDIAVCDGYLHKWRVGADVTTFFRDAEFSSKHTRGYTALGYFLNPHVSSLFRKDAQITLGADLTGIAGLDGFWKARPLVRLEYAPSEHVTLVMGTLYGGNSHHLYEPMWCLENTILDHTEQGLEIFNHRHWGFMKVDGDTWINWQDFLQPWEAKQEVFTAGTSQRLLFKEPTKAVNRVQISIPFSFLGQHHGGQFTALDTCVTTLFNESVGLSADFMLGESSFYNGRWLSVNLPVFFYQNASPGTEGRATTPYADGFGYYPQLTYQHFWSKDHVVVESDVPTWHRITAQMAYWCGSQWIAPVGSYHFQSVSWHLSDYTDATRSLITSRFAYEHYRNRITFGADLQLYYDIANAQTDCAFGLYLRAQL